MNAHGLSLGSHWIVHFMAGIRLVHLLTHLDPQVVPRAGFTPEEAVKVLNEIVDGKYRPQDHFVHNETQSPGMTTSAPRIDPQSEYLVFRLNLVTSMAYKISGNTGGVVFEDPFWAVYAAYSAWFTQRKDVTGRLERPWVGIPLASDNQQLWKNAPIAYAAVEHGNYKPEQFLSAAKGFLPPSNRPNFDLMTLPAETIEALRAHGKLTISHDGSALLVELYDVPIKSN
jgi:hypothetical protein